SHSMGGIVMMEALKCDLSLGRTNVDNYVLMQAAVPADCYDSNSPIHFPFIYAEDVNVSTPNTYFKYPGTISGALHGRMGNFYNTNDFALATGTLPALGGVSWQDNQLSYKPDTGFGYTTDGTNGFKNSVL